MSGWVHAITGPMFSGKTDFLIRKLKRYDLMGRESIVFRPDIDNRITAFASRSGLEYPSHVSVPNSAYMASLIPANADLRIVAIDEAQFFDDLLPVVIRTFADFMGLTVLVAGLDRDFLRRPFGPMAEVLTEADEVTKLTAVCFKCSGEATLTQRLINGIPASADDPTILIGGMGDDKYEARCRDHYEVA